MPEPIPAATAIRSRVRLQRCIAETERAMDGLCERGVALLSGVADAYRTAVGIYVSDPTLENCTAGRERQLDLAEEFCRQVRSLVRSATSGRGADRWPVEDRWEEAEAIAARLPDVLAEARAQARPDHATPAGSRAISRMWLAAASHRISAAGEALREALTKASSVPYPAPEIAELEALAAEVIKRAEALEGDRD